jgi:hypothetical protein
VPTAASRRICRRGYHGSRARPPAPVARSRALRRVFPAVPRKGATPEPFGSIGLIEGSGAGWLRWICPLQRMAAPSEQPPHMSNKQSKCRTTSFLVYRRRYDARECATTDLFCGEQN